ncbi:hypothetical protein ACB087_04085 [Vibrio sp. VNB-15]
MLALIVLLVFVIAFVGLMAELDGDMWWLALFSVFYWVVLNEHTTQVVLRGLSS